MTNRILAPPEGAHPKIATLYRYWQNAAPQGALPGRRNIDPVDIPQLLANIWLLDVVGEPLRFRFRLIGDAMRRIGIPAKRGEFVDQYNTDDAEPVQDMHFAVRERRPVWYRGRAFFPLRGEIAELERVLMPLAADGRTVDVLLGLTVFYGSDGREI